MPDIENRIPRKGNITILKNRETEMLIIEKSPLRLAVDESLKIRGEQIAAYYNDAIQHGMSPMKAREAFITAMNAEYCECLPDIMPDIPTYLIAIPDSTRTIDADKEKEAQAVINNLLYSPMSEWERIKEIAYKETGHRGALL